MILNFKELASKDGAVQLHEQKDITNLIKGLKDIKSAQSLRIDLEAAYAAEAVHVNGVLSTELECVCSRCLSHFTEQLIIPFHEAFVLADSSAVSDDDDMHRVAENKFDLMPYIEENVVTELPYIPLCDEDCKGLCTICGCNLNEQSCNCVPDLTDPRLAVLKDFFNPST